jgi:hypothetical protein
MIGCLRGLSKRLLAHPGALAATCFAGLLLAGCHGVRDEAAPASSAADSDKAAAAQDTGYVRPPVVSAAARASSAVVLSGRSDPNARIRLSAPDGNAYGATATAAGTWALAVPVQADVREFGLSEVLGDGGIQTSRTIQGDGYIAVLPSPGRPAVVLHAGGGSQALSDIDPAPQLTTVDYDSGGGAVVSGLAKPGAPVRLSVDGGASVEARPDARGWFQAALPGMLKVGSHQATVQFADGERKAAFTLASAAPISGVPYRGQRQAAGWRIDWLTPGGAAQTTLVLDAPQAANKP